MLKILGYPSRYSVAPGEEISFHVSAEEGQDYEATLLRVICGDANPDGPGVQYERIPSAIDGSYAGRRQITDAGSYMRADVPQLAAQQGALTFAAMVWPTMIKRDDQTVMSWQDAASGIRLFFRKGGVLCAVIRNGEQSLHLHLDETPVLERQWYAVGLSLDPESGKARLFQTALRQFAMTRDSGSAEGSFAGPLPAPVAPVLLAGAQSGDQVGAHFDGKIDGPAFLRGVHDAESYHRFLHKRTHHADQLQRIAQWDFSTGIKGVTATDISPNGNHGELFNCPGRGMKGWNWDGTRHRWSENADHYGAVHFHHDDLYDAAWQTAFTLTIPDDMKSDAYAVRVKSGENSREETRDYYIPFFVRPKRRPANLPGKRDRIAFLAPTVSYMAYANHGEHITAREAERVIGRLLEFGHADMYMYEHPEIGGSVYDKHADESGVFYSSRLRPVLNFTSQYHSWLGGHGSSVWQYNADIHLLAWLNQNGFDYDVITDEDMHHEGKRLLDDYRVVMTGTHPEYYTGKMWTALKGWVDDGGRLMYLGANGFYWHVEFSEAMPGVMEIRKAEDGTRTVEPEPGEYYHSFSGELSGLYRRKGHPPNEMCGLGFVAQGFDVCSYYRRAPDAENPRAAFIFAGVPDEIIGDFGLIGGGAAGLELDAMNPLLGTPPNALRLATSEGHSQQVQVVNEEFGIPPIALGGDQHDKVRADLCFYETPSGGAVFSVGSISWCGSLLWNGGDNNVSAITANVLRRFADPAPFDTE